MIVYMVPIFIKTDEGAAFPVYETLEEAETAAIIHGILLEDIEEYEIDMTGYN